MKLIASLLVTASLVACGGGSYSSSAPSAPPVSTAVDVVATVNMEVAVMDSAVDSSEPMAIDAVTVATSEDGEPAPV